MVEDKGQIMSSYMMMPKDYARDLMKDKNRSKACAFLEYCFDIDEKISNSYRFYARKWGVSVSTSHEWVSSFRDEINAHHAFWIEKNNEIYRTRAEQTPNTKPNTRSPIDTAVEAIQSNAQSNDFRTPAEQRVNTKKLNIKTKAKKAEKDLLTSYKENHPTNEKLEIILADFISYRLEISDPLKTVHALRGFVSNLKKLNDKGFDIQVAIDEMKQNEWKTIKPEYLGDKYAV